MQDYLGTFGGSSSVGVAKVRLASNFKLVAARFSEVAARFFEVATRFFEVATSESKSFQQQFWEQLAFVF
jgi:hypothetical protein